ncbi:MAG: pectinesterase family protein, partial [Limisphaerales bacterium]
GKNAVGYATNNVTCGMQFQLNMNSSATSISIGTSSSSFSSAGAAMTNGAGSVNQLSYSSAVSLSTLPVTNFNEFCFMFNNTAATNILVTLSGITLVPANPVIVTQPFNTGGSPGGDYSFSVALNPNSGAPLSYQWYQIINSVTNALADGATGNGSTIAGSGTATLTINNAQASDSSAVFVVVTNAYGAATSSVATLFVSATPTVPVINFVSPSNAMVIAGSDTNIFVSAYAAPTPTISWYDNNSNLIQSSLSTELSLTNLQLTNAGTYTVVAGNSAGSVSTNFTVNVIVTPVIASAPTNLLLNAGDAANFSVTASGTPRPTYQWYKNNALIPGATGTNYSIASVALTDIGTYSVVISNAAGAVTASAYLAIYSGMTAAPAAPVNGAENVCVDTPLSLTFSQKPSVGTTGKIQIYDESNPGAPVDTLDMSGGNLQPRTIGGIALNAYNILISGDTATLYPHSGVLTAGHTYYVTMDPGVIVDANGAYFKGVAGSTTWQFTTKSEGPANPTDLVVAADGSGDFCTVQGAIDSIASGNTTPITINIRDGVYTEIDRVNMKNDLTFIGQDRHQTIITYANNNNINGSTTTRPMFGVSQANDITLENLTLTNSTPLGGSQAEALLVNYAKQFMVLDCDLDSYQDTLLVNQSGDQAYIQDSYIQGNTDYIWGSGTLYVTNSILMDLTSGSHLTQARTAQTTNGFAFVNCRILGAASGAGNSDLGRDAGSSGNTANYPYGQVAYIHCTMDTNVVIPAGWILGSGTTQGPDTANLRFWEYQSVDTNGVLIPTGSRVPWSVELDGVTATNDVQNVTNWLYGWQPELAPWIFSQPTNVTVGLGGTVAFTVGADGVASPVYQWLQNGTNAPYASANSAMLIISNATANANYSVIISNAAGAVTSGVVQLTVTIPQPAAISRPAEAANGSFQFVISGAQGQDYRVWATTNLLLSPVTRTWTLVTNATFGATPVIFSDPGAGVAPRRFYTITEP